MHEMSTSLLYFTFQNKTFTVLLEHGIDTVKAKFHWDQFLVANVTTKSPTSYRLVTRKLVMSLGMSLTGYEEVGDVANKSARKLRGS